MSYGEKSRGGVEDRRLASHPSLFAGDIVQGKSGIKNSLCAVCSVRKVELLLLLQMPQYAKSGQPASGSFVPNRKGNSLWKEVESAFVWPWVLGSSRQVAPLPSTLLLNFCLSFSEPPAALLHIISLKLLKPGTGVLATLLLTLQGVDADKQSMQTLAVGAPEWICPEGMLQPWGRCISSSFFPQNLLGTGRFVCFLLFCFSHLCHVAFKTSGFASPPLENGLQ